MKTEAEMTKNWVLVCIFFIIFLSLSYGCYSVTGIISKGSYVTISVSEAKDLIESNDELFILDVREPWEFEDGHISGAYLIPVNDISARENELPKNKSKPILVYCRSGGRSVTASNTLDSLGYTQVNNMDSGFNAWKNAGYPYETGPFIKPTITITSSRNTTQLSSEVTSSSSKQSINTPSFELTLGLISLFFVILKKQQNKRKEFF
ncbi:MAG: rhodanese-like domain-containing protein [Candidatus Heimdallarchaeota archaeon]|nr:MAG: rhodanese-like domain-containing protein [Candidatus Heimdallarchaeota archaeon]